MEGRRMKPHLLEQPESLTPGQVRQRFQAFVFEQAVGRPELRPGRVRCKQTGHRHFGTAKPSQNMNFTGHGRSLARLAQLDDDGTGVPMDADDQVVLAGQPLEPSKASDVLLGDATDTAQLIGGVRLGGHRRRRYHPRGMVDLGTRIASGRQAELFVRPGGRVLKLFRPDCRGESIDREILNSQTVYAAGVRAPAILEQIEVDGRRGLLFEQLEGPTLLEQMLRALPDQWAEYARLLGDLHVELHGHRLPQLPSQRARLLDRLERGGLPDDVRDAARRRLDQLPDGDALCHGDFHPINVLIAPTGPVVLDWMDATAGQPIADVARTLLLIRHAGHPIGPREGTEAMTQQARDAFMKAYLATYVESRPLSATNLNSWMLPVAAARLVEAQEAGEAAALRHQIGLLLQAD